MEELRLGVADVLVVAKLDRLSRSLMDFASLMERSRDEGWSLVALDLGVDTSTPQGEMLASVMTSFAQFERRLIGVRTREALAAKRAMGVQLGRPAVVLPEIDVQVAQLRGEGKSYRAICEHLHAAGISPPGTGRWHPNLVRRIVLRIDHSAP
jgi:DNA invertase Pin-like site-specific DNA recombinase